MRYAEPTVRDLKTREAEMLNSASETWYEKESNSGISCVRETVLDITLRLGHYRLYVMFYGLRWFRRSSFRNSPLVSVWWEKKGNHCYWRKSVYDVLSLLVWTGILLRHCPRGIDYGYSLLPPHWTDWTNYFSSLEWPWLLDNNPN